MDSENTNSEGITTITLAELYEKEGQLEEAAEIYRKIIREEPQNATVRNRLQDIERQLRLQWEKETTDSDDVQDKVTEEIPMTGNLVSSLESIDSDLFDRDINPAESSGSVQGSAKEPALSADEKTRLEKQLQKFKDRITRWSHKTERTRDGGNS